MGFGAGAAHLVTGLRLWRTRPRLMLLGLVPALIVAIVVLAWLVTLAVYADDLVRAATPFADDWSASLRSALRVVLALVLLASAVMLATVTFTGLTLAVGDPFYEHIWAQVERSLGGPVPERGLGWWRGLVDGLVLAGAGLLLGLGVFVAGLLPVVGAVLGTVLGLVVSGRLLAGELVSRPLEARGLDRAERRRLLRPHRRGLLGFGVAVQACCLVPLGAVAVMPAAVAGATHLARAVLEADQPTG